MSENEIEEALSPERMTAADAYSNPAARLGFGAVNLAEGVQYPLTRLTYDYMMLLSLYRSSGILRRIVNKPVEDAVSHWFKIDSQITPEEIEMMERLQRRTRIKKQIETGLKWGRLFGGAAGLILIEGQGDFLDQPLDLASVEADAFKGVYIVDRWSGVYPSLETVADIGSSAFGEPAFYELRPSEESTATMRVHHSRVLRFTGDELPYWEKQVEQYWGSSIIETVFDDLKRYDSTLSNIESLLYKAQVWVQKTDNLKQLLAMGPQKMQQNFVDTVQAQNAILSSFNTRLIDKDDDLQDHQYTFSGLDKVFETFMYALSSATGIPVTVLFGRSASGLDATGDGDLENYYTMLEGIQENKIRPLLEQLLPVMFMSEFGAVPDDLNIVFNPVRVATEKEKAEIAQNETAAVMSAYDGSVLGRQTALKELRQIGDKTGLFTNITDEMIKQAKDEPEAGDVPGIEDLLDSSDPDEKSAHDAAGDWDENKHPRRDDGKFGEGSGNPKNSLTKEDKSDNLKSSFNPSAKQFDSSEFKGKVWVEGEGYYRLAKGTKVSKVVSFAGKGTKVIFRSAPKLSNKFGGDVAGWQHTRGEGLVDYKGSSRRAELHWFQHEVVGRIRMKVKRWFD